MDLRPVATDDRSLEEVSALLARAFPGVSHLGRDYLAWAYRDGPDGSVVGFNAYDGGRLAAHYVTQPLRARVNEVEERGLLSFHTATDPDFRGRGLFPRLARATFEEAARRGYGHVVGVANAASSPGFVGKLGFQLVAPLDVRIGLGPRAGGRSGPTPRYERLWSRSAARWRLACPARRYRAVGRAEKTVVYAPTGRLGIWVELARLPRELAAAVEPLRAHPLRLWIGLEPGGARWPLSARVPTRLRPSPLNLIFLDLTRAGRRLDAAEVRFSAMDFDAY